MRLKLLLPSRVFAEAEDVVRIVAETPEGAFGILPKRLDCVAPLVPGILTYEQRGKGEMFVAVDEGLLVKTGDEVLVSVRGAVAGSELGSLREAVAQEFLALDEDEKSFRSAMAKLETDFVRRMLEFSQHGRS